MKKLISLFILFFIMLLAGCSEYVKDYDYIVVGIHRQVEPNNFDYRYELRHVSGDTEINLYTNKEYAVGDTLRISK